MRRFLKEVKSISRTPTDGPQDGSLGVQLLPHYEGGEFKGLVLHSLWVGEGITVSWCRETQTLPLTLFIDFLVLVLQKVYGIITDIRGDTETREQKL